MDGRKDYRVEMDSVGAKDVPENVYYGVQSMRAAENFQITGLNMHPEIINSLAYIKKAAAITNCEIGLLEKKTAEAIVQACDEILEGRFHEDFIVDPIQGGAGTSLNMNANEVIANRAIEILGGQKGDYFIVSPNDHVNCGQSTNDVIPTAGKMTSLRLLKNLKSELMRLHREFSHKAEEFDHVIKMGRTQMQDAVPIRLGQEFKAYSVAVMRDIRRMDKAMEEFELALNTQGQEEEVERLYDLIISEFDRLATMAYMAQIMYDRDISDQEAAGEQAYTTQLYSEMGNKAAACLQKGLQSSYRSLLEEKIGEAYVPKIAYYEDYSQEELDLHRKEEDLIREYDQLASGSISVEYDGEQWDYGRLEKEPDMDTADYREVSEALGRERNRILGDKYLELVKVRGEIAGSAGYDNYAEYAHETIYGRGYTLKDTRQLCQNVKDNIVVLSDNIWYLWSEAVDNASYDSLDLLEDSTAEEILDTVGDGMDQMVPKLGEVFRYMRDNHLYDIQAGEDSVERTDGSYTVGLPSYKDAFIFINRDNTFRDYQSLIHEFGHFCSYYYNTVPEMYQGFHVDVCELQSQGLEMLSTRYAGSLFGEGDSAYTYETMSDMLYVAITACMIQEFEEAVYTTPDMTLDDMNRRFKEIQDSYDGWYYRVYGNMCYDWVDIPHLFYSPMYYIGYGTSALSALDLWVLSGEDWDGAVDIYLGILNEGLEAPYRGTMDRWGMKDVFDEADIKELSLELGRIAGTGSMEAENSAQPDGEAPGVSANETSAAQDNRSVQFIILAGIGTVIVLQVLIISVGLVILWEVRKKR